MSKPVLAVTIGDPCGVGPEILARSVATGEPQAMARLLFIGSAQAMRQGIEVVGADLKVEPVDVPAAIVDDPKVISILDTGALDPAEIVYGEELDFSPAFSVDFDLAMGLSLLLIFVVGSVIWYRQYWKRDHAVG